MIRRNPSLVAKAWRRMICCSTWRQKLKRKSPSRRLTGSSFNFSNRGTLSNNSGTNSISPCHNSGAHQCEEWTWRVDLGSSSRIATQNSLIVRSPLPKCARFMCLQEGRECTSPLPIFPRELIHTAINLGAICEDTWNLEPCDS